MSNDFHLNVEYLSKELKLLLEILKLQNDDIVLENQSEWIVDIDWNKFLELAMHHRVHPYIYPKVNEVNKGLIPSHIMNILRQNFKENMFRMLFLSSEMEQVSKWFIENEISTLFLKGPALAHDLYGNVSLRTSCDLDILIPINQLEKAERILLEQGYVKDEYIQTVLNDWKWRHHHITFFHPEKKIKLEIHWRLNPGPGKEMKFVELWRRKRKSTLVSNPVYVLGKEDLFIFLCSHGARHGWSRLRWLVDVNKMIDQELNWLEINQLLNKYQSGHIVGQALILSNGLLNSTISEEMKIWTNKKYARRLAQDALFYLKQMINLHTPPIPEEISKYHSRHLYSLMSKRQRFLFILSYLYPYPIDAKTLPLPKYLHFLYFPLRPLLCTWRRVRKHELS